jgi:Domain of unknown function (DUF4148)
MTHIKLQLAAAIVLTTASLSAWADANHSYPSATVPGLIQNDAVTSTATGTAQPKQLGKTRAQVRQELIEARRQGIIPTTNADYPPSQRTINANKTRNAIVERYWADSSDNSNIATP